MFTRTINFLGNTYTYSHEDIRKVDAIARSMEDINFRATERAYGRSFRSATITSRIADGNTFWELHAVMEITPKTWKFVKLQLSQLKDEHRGLGMGLYVNADREKINKGFWQYWDKDAQQAYYLVDGEWTSDGGPVPPLVTPSPPLEPDDGLPF